MTAAAATSLYVHAPFCPSRCGYCDFAVAVTASPDPEAWLEALKVEWWGILDEGRIPVASSFDTLFVGGGTPSYLGPGAMAGLAAVLGPGRLKAPGLEWTGEANAESFTREVAEGWRAAGVTRVSLGAQSFQPSVLGWMGRIHGAEEPSRAVARAREAGIENLSLDLIFGLPDEVERDWRLELEGALALEVPHLSLYGLTVEPGTPLGRDVRAGRLTPCSDERYRDEYLKATELLSTAGYGHYEVSNFALPGREARHNLACWELRPYVGLGNGAHSFLHPLRRWNLRGWDAYQRAVEAGRTPVEGQEVLTPEQTRMESLWLGLRSARGCSLKGAPEAVRRRARAWQRQGLARLEEDTLALTPRGWLRLDRLTVELDEAWDEGSASWVDGASGPLRSS